MKKTFKFYVIFWVVLFALFNVIAFASVGWDYQEKYTASFWIGYVFIIIAFLGQLLCAYFAFKATELKKTFYNISLITTSYSGLIVSFIVGGMCMLISSLPYWIAIICCSIILAINVFSVVRVSATIEIVNNVDKKIKTQTFFIKSLTVDAEVLMSKATTTEIKNECNKVYEAVRYSDPMSNDMLSSVENQIAVKFSEFSEAVNKSESENINSVSKELLSLIEERNKKCKLLK